MSLDTRRRFLAGGEGWGRNKSSEHGGKRPGLGSGDLGHSGTVTLEVMTSGHLFSHQ